MAFPSVTVTGTFDTLIGADTGYAIFELVNAQGSGYAGVPSIARIPGWCVLSTTKFQTAVGASFSITVWGNDAISPAGTLYKISLYDAEGILAGTGIYNLTGAASYDLSTLTPA